MLSYWLFHLLYSSLLKISSPFRHIFWFSWFIQPIVSQNLKDCTKHIWWGSVTLFGRSLNTPVLRSYMEQDFSKGRFWRRVFFSSLSFCSHMRSYSPDFKDFVWDILASKTFFIFSDKDKVTIISNLWAELCQPIWYEEKEYNVIYDYLNINSWNANKHRPMIHCETYLLDLKSFWNKFFTQKI